LSSLSRPPSSSFRPPPRLAPSTPRLALPPLRLAIPPSPPRLAPSLPYLAPPSPCRFLLLLVVVVSPLLIISPLFPLLLVSPLHLLVVSCSSVAVVGMVVEVLVEAGVALSSLRRWMRLCCRWVALSPALGGGSCGGGDCRGYGIRKVQWGWKKDRGAKTNHDKRRGSQLTRGPPLRGCSIVFSPSFPSSFPPASPRVSSSFVSSFHPPSPPRWRKPTTTNVVVRVSQLTHGPPLRGCPLVFFLPGSTIERVQAAHRVVPTTFIIKSRQMPALSFVCCQGFL
jgi:hypothetical protein